MIPHRRRDTNTDFPSACNNGNHDPSTKLGYACPHQLMFSSDMILAAMRDGFDEGFYYGTAAVQSDNDCGKCYQVSVGKQNLKMEKQLILQITNTGFDVVAGQFDVYVAAGGFGWYTACNSDCQSRSCQGGVCTRGMYDGSFDQWNAVSRDCYGGGLNLVSEPDRETIWNYCAGLTNGFEETPVYKDDALRQGCWLSNVFNYHQNFDTVDSTQVKCPPSLTLVTGLKRQDDYSVPDASLSNQLPTQCRRPNCMTTYHDCCKPSCAWKGKGNPDSTFSRVDTCDSEGLIWGY